MPDRQRGEAQDRFDSLGPRAHERVKRRDVGRTKFRYRCCRVVIVGGVFDFVVVGFVPDQVQDVMERFVGWVRLDVAELVENALDSPAGVFDRRWRRFA